MNGTNSALVRFAHRVYQGRNSLARPGDRAEGVLLALVLLAGLFSVPAVAAFGSEFHARQLAVVAEQTSNRVAVTGVLTEDAPTPGQAMARVYAAARWTRPDGASGTGVVEAPGGASKGSTVTIWLDRAGSPTVAPLTADGALLVTLLTVGAVWACVLLGLALLHQGTTRLVRRLRTRQWAREWRVIGPQWTGRSAR